VLRTGADEIQIPASEGINDESLLLTSRFHQHYRSTFPARSVRSAAPPPTSATWPWAGRCGLSQRPFNWRGAVILEAAAASFQARRRRFYLNEYLDGQKIEEPSW
jgi:hypothetical protein